jgi:PAS domain S-box-containing protein
MSLSIEPSTIASLRSELISAGDNLADNADVLRSVLAASGDCIKILDLDGRLQFMSEGGKRVMEVEDFSTLKGCPWPDFWAGSGNDDAKKAIATAIAGRTARFRGAANTAKGTPRYWDVRVSPVLNEDGMPIHILSISRDITDEWRAEKELREAAERQALLTGELAHRIKNTLAMVGAIANQTMRGDSVPDARAAFAARLMTLSHAHDILTKTSWASAPIKDVIEGALAPHRSGQDRIRLHGPDVLLEPKQALALAVALHELATNATKYGSLSGDGTVDIGWSNGGETPAFRFTWREAGGPAVTEPAPGKKGFGSRLIEKMLASDFSGHVRINYDIGGLECELVAPFIGQTTQTKGGTDGSV